MSLSSCWLPLLYSLYIASNSGTPPKSQTLVLCKYLTLESFRIYFCHPRFTNMAYGTPHTPVASTGSAQELSTVQIVKRGTTVGYDNPGFDSPMAFSRQTSRPLLSTMDWPESPAINSADSVICEGSSTPARSRASGRDDDSAFQEPSVSSVAVSYSVCIIHLDIILCFLGFFIRRQSKFLHG